MATINIPVPDLSGFPLSGVMAHAGALAGMAYGLYGYFEAGMPLATALTYVGAGVAGSGLGALFAKILGCLAAHKDQIEELRALMLALSKVPVNVAAPLGPGTAAYITGNAAP